MRGVEKVIRRKEKGTEEGKSRRENESGEENAI